MHKISLTVKDLEGFSFSIDSDGGKGDNIETPFDNDAFHITREQAEEMAFRELMQKLSVGSVPCGRCEKPVTQADCSDAYILYDENETPQAAVYCFDCEVVENRIRSAGMNRRNAGWHQRNNPGGPDDMPTATIARADFDDLLRQREIYRDLVKKLGVMAITDGAPILAEHFVERHSGSPMLGEDSDNATVSVVVTVKSSYPCTCNIDDRGDGELCRDVDVSGNHVHTTNVKLSDVLSYLGFEIDAGAFNLAARMAAEGYAKAQSKKTQFPFK